MPHDVKGEVLAVGDEVILRARVTNVQLGEDYCNVTIESVQPRKPDGLKDTCCLNAGVLEKVQP